jgi:predicted CoA-binding protein
MPLKQASEIREVLEQAKTIAVVGYKPGRPSYGVAHALRSLGYDVYFVNPTLTSTPETQIYARVTDIPVPIDIVNIFRRPDLVMPIVQDAITAGAKVIWMQLGIVNEEAARAAEEAGLKVIMDRCSKVEYMRHFGTAVHV